MIKLGIVCGLALEAAIVKRAASDLAPEAVPFIVHSGPGPERASAVTSRLIERGAEALLSFGLAGGLEPTLRNGDVVIASAINTGQSDLKCDAAWATRLYGGLTNAFNVFMAPLAASQDVLKTPENKAEAFKTTGAAAVDMESAGIAEAAAAKGLPFTALRVVCDRADETIPPIAAEAMTWEGRVRATATVLRALTHPAQIPDLVRLGARTHSARRVLGKLAGFGLRHGFFASG
ncbi:MAG: hypothetical protein RLN70_05710 [Rhodospirillaceae bacterium]